MRNFTPHTIRVYSNTVFDTACRKCRLTSQSELVAEFPSDGMLNAIQSKAEEPTIVDGIPMMAAPTFIGVDQLPDGDDKLIVSALFVSACKQNGIATDRLLTIGNAVINDQNQIIGCSCLMWN